MSKLRAFFAANPGEELTYEQAMVKLGVSRRDLNVALWMLRERGEVETEVVRLIRAPKMDA